MPVLTQKIELDGTYEGWWFIARTNPKMQIFNLLMSGTYHNMIMALSELVAGEWNFVDEEGEPLARPDLTRENHCKWEADMKAWETNGKDGDPPDEPMTTEALIGQLTVDLVMQMSQKVGAAVQDVPGN
jgi:hypothetical protein